MSQYIFGEIDVSNLDLDQSPISPFDVSRSMQLNPNNDLVRVIHAFIGQKVEEVRRSLLDAERQRRASEEARRLAQQAAEIASVINQDFQSFRERVTKAKAKARGGFDSHSVRSIAEEGEDDLLFGSDLPADLVAPGGDPGSSGSSGYGGTQVSSAGAQVTPGAAGAERRGQLAKATESERKPRGGFQVQFKEMGAETHRAKYERDERTIYINLDHPQLVAAKGIGGIEDAAFRRLAYEVAFSEYAIALASELAARDEYYEYYEPIVDIRETLNRVARKGAGLYSQ